MSGGAGGGRQARRRAGGRRGGSRLPADLELHIERLVVRSPGLPGRHRIAPAIRAELERLIAEHGLPRTIGEGGSAIRLEGGVYRVDPGAGAEAIGTHVARQLHGAWRGGE